MKKLFAAALMVLPVAFVHGALVVAPEGVDTNPGTLEQPLRTIPRAITLATAGDTIFVRGSIYELGTTISIAAAQSGTDSSRYHLWGYPGERPVLDFTGQAFGGKGINLKASYWHLKDLDVRGAGDNGLYIGGGAHNIVETCNFYENRDSGVQLDNGAHDNRFINCDSWHNADPGDYGDADGFAPKLTVGSGNYFYGCRAWGNCDDGWDGYMRGATNVTTTLEQCWTWGNGWLKDGSDPGTQANGNGFKMGGGDNSNRDHLMHHFILRHCLAFNNKAKGFDQNNNAGSMTLLNCSGFGNRSANYRITKALNAGETLTVRNCLSFNGSAELGATAIQETNSWLLPIALSAQDFVSLDPACAAAPRRADGTLPDIPFLHLASASALIDAGTDIGMAFFGKAPDLGAFESNYFSCAEAATPQGLNHRLQQNYPNPFNPRTRIGYTLAAATPVSLKIYNVRGELVDVLVDAWQPAGTYQVTWQPENLAAGLYFCRLEANRHAEVRRLLLQK